MYSCMPLHTKNDTDREPTPLGTKLICFRRSRTVREAQAFYSKSASPRVGWSIATFAGIFPHKYIEKVSSLCPSQLLHPTHGPGANLWKVKLIYCC